MLCSFLVWLGPVGLVLVQPVVALLALVGRVVQLGAPVLTRPR